MGTRYKKGKSDGFTIIEVVLFLGISGLLAMTLLGGWTTMINTQRYKDSVKTVQTFLQTQYNLVYNVENAGQADGEPFCRLNGSNEPVFGTSGNASERGQSDCILMGRLITISGGTQIQAYPIVGADLKNSATTDRDEILERNPTVATGENLITDNELQVPWQARVVNPRPSTSNQNVALAIIRSPLTGSVHTYVATTDGQNLPSLSEAIAPVNEREVNLCLDPEVAFAGERIGVVIREKSSAQSFVQTITDGSVC